MAAAKEMAPSDENEFVPQSPQDVAKRVLALLAVVDKAHNENADELNHWVSVHQIHKYFSPVELAFFNTEVPSEQEIQNQSWRAEALVPLFWALGQLDELPPLNVQISWDDIKEFDSVIDDPDAFILNAELRSNDILQEAEQHLYHQHWRVRDAELFGKPMPPDLQPGIVYERRYGASWLVGWGDDWDNVPTDT